MGKFEKAIIIIGAILFVASPFLDAITYKFALGVMSIGFFSVFVTKGGSRRDITKNLLEKTEQGRAATFSFTSLIIGTILLYISLS